MKHYVELNPETGEPRALYRAQDEPAQVETWRGGEWVLSPFTVSQLEGLGGDSYYEVRPADLKRLQKALA